MSWNIGDNRNIFLKLKTKLGLYYVELRSKDFPETVTLSLVETQQLPELTEKNIIKELGLFIDGSLQGFFFCPPKIFKPNEQMSWITKHLHGIA